MVAEPDFNQFFEDMEEHSIPLSDQITLRDYFAAAALRMCTEQGYTATGPDWPQAVANCCYEIADAMLAEREKE